MMKFRSIISIRNKDHKFKRRELYMQNNQVKVLMIDDDEVIAQSTAEYFNMFDVKTAYVNSYDDAVAFLEKNIVSLLLIDINLGEKSGFDLCKEVRKNYDMPILFISARTSDDDVLIALNIGGDDYIKKPYTLSILLAKVKAVLARYEKSRDELIALSSNGSGKAPVVKEVQNNNGLVSISDSVSLDTRAHVLVCNGRTVTLKDMEYKLLYYLLQNVGRVVTKDELLKNVWEDEFIGEGTIAVHIRHLREKAGDDSQELIRTIWGVGYMLNEKIH